MTVQVNQWYTVSYMNMLKTDSEWDFRLLQWQVWRLHFLGCSLEVEWRFRGAYCLDDADSMHLWNVDLLQQDWMVLHSLKLSLLNYYKLLETFCFVWYVCDVKTCRFYMFEHGKYVLSHFMNVLAELYVLAMSFPVTRKCRRNDRSRYWCKSTKSCIK
jgi:hypothetical protein